MIFSSATFIFLFLPIVFLMVLITPKKIHNLILLVASLVFYAWGEPTYIILMLVSSLVNYFLAKKVYQNKFTLLFAIIFNIGTLFIFKYLNFFIENLNQLSIHLPYIYLALPVGISFYTFQTLSYVLDVYAGKTKVQQSYFKLLLYIAFFPQLIAGPIVKYQDINEEISHRTMSIEGITNGFYRFILGLSKKIIIANTMAVVVDRLYPLEASTLIVWIIALCYMLQIYFDFSGYSDMAIGLGEIFGFHFKENFNYPFSATSMGDFWRKWHISLSSWFKEYVYIPLGGNRENVIRNLGIVFLLTGIWHGANWTFVIWGIWQFVWVALEKKIKLSTPKFLNHIYTLLIVCIGFMIFRAETMFDFWTRFKALWIFIPTNAFTLSEVLLWITPATVVIFILGFYFAFKQRIALKPTHVKHYIISLVLLVLCVLYISTSGYNPFIYFRF